ncbi:MAG: class C sortase [Peptoniphilus sp.]|nr:class C sortase [Peptoniphilus sp.]MDD7363307.1 class C sortase [Bacillota bacterium]MDY6045263.1 class C sortase [Peptoniphilus sp.]
MKATNLNKKKWPFVLLFTLGFLLMIYPVISNFYYRIESDKENAAFDKAASEMDKEEIRRRIELARAYNATLDPSRLADPFTKKEKEGVAEYARMLEVHEQLGHVRIPKIDVDLPIFAGTSEEVLQKGAGHLEGTSLPIGGKSTHTVITAHRGLPKAKMFRNLDRLEKGDVFYIQNIETVLCYKVDRILTVDPSNFEPILVQEGEDKATLLTCTPYMINSHRLLVTGHRIPYTPPADELSVGPLGSDFSYRDFLMFMIPAILVLLALAIYNGREMKKAEKRLRDYEKK